MFIRDQRGSVLCNTDNLISISVEENSFVVMIMARPIAGKTITLGTYESRKKAENVLDDIGRAVKDPSKGVFFMPTE